MNIRTRALEKFKKHKHVLGAIELLKYIGPAFLVTVGFIDPGNWAANVAAGSAFGYKLLWVVALATVMLIFLQHYSAHLGIVTGLCISEAATKYFKKWVSRVFLATAVLASISTAFAELLGSAIGLNMLFGVPIWIGAILTALLIITMLITNSYRKIERWIIGLVSLISLSFLYEVLICPVEWGRTLECVFTPSIPPGAMPLIMSVLGAVVMPHNLFLHSEVIQSRKWNMEDEKIKNRQLKYEFMDTFAAMGVGWAINSAMMIVAAAVFFANGTVVTELQQAKEMLHPLMGNISATVFAFALLCAGVASSITAAIAGGSIFSGIFGEPFNMKDIHSRCGILITIIGALLVFPFVSDLFKGLIWSQVILSMQLPLTIIALLYLTASKRVMGRHKNRPLTNVITWAIAAVVIGLNIILIFKICSGRL